MKIITASNPVLTKTAAPVKKFDKKLQKIILEMKETLLATSDPIGVGLAAPQVGLAISIFLARPNAKSEIISFINPKIISISDEENDEIPQSVKISRAKQQGKIPDKNKLLEGCLSIPNIWGYVSRKKELILSFQDENGKVHNKKFRGFPAVIIQHEIDHLEGRLFTKHVLEQGEKLYRSYKNEKGEDEFEEVKI